MPENGSLEGTTRAPSLGCRLFVFLYVVFKTPDSGGMMVPLVLNIFIDKNLDPGRTRTCNPLIRSQMPYPLGHRASLGLRDNKMQDMVTTLQLGSLV